MPWSAVELARTLLALSSHSQSSCEVHDERWACPPFRGDHLGRLGPVNRKTGIHRIDSSLVLHADVLGFGSCYRRLAMLELGQNCLRHLELMERERWPQLFIATEVNEAQGLLVKFRGE